MSTKIYSKLHGLARMIALVAILCLPFLSVSVEAQCPAPTGIRVATAAPEAVTLQWTVAAADEHHYDIRVATRQLTSAELGAGAAGTATAATEGVVFFKNDTVLATSVFQATGLTAGSQYYLHLRKNCAWDDAGYSSWVTYAFNTPCQATAALPIAEGFNADALPSCWSLGGNAPTVYSSTKHGSEGKSIKLTATASEGSFLYSPVLATSANAYYLTGYAYGAKNAVLKLGFALTEDLQTVVEVGEVTIATGYTWQAFDAVIPALYQAACATAEYVWVIYTAPGNTTTVYVDDITLTTVPSCVAPVAFEVNNITEAGATLSWTERGTATAWNVQLVQGTDTTLVSATANPFTLSNLSANTSYKVRVQAACASESSDWSAWVSFKTPCGVVSLPFTEGFDETPFVPDCWYTAHLLGTGGGWARSTSTKHSGAAGAMLNDANDGNVNILSTPMFHSDAANSLYVSFWMKRDMGGTYATSAYYDEGVRVWVNTVNNATAGGTALLYVPRVANATQTGIKVAPEAAAGWYKYEALIPVAGDFCLIFEGISKYGSASYIDDIAIKVVPTCLEPSGLRLGETTSEGAKLIWNAGEATSWQLTYKLATGDVQSVIVNGTPEYTITGLTSNTQYTLSNLGLRAICSATDTSDVFTVDNITFRTACAAVELPIVENVTAGSFPACWIAGGWTIYTSASSYAHTGSNALRCYYYTENNDVPMQSPSFEVEAGKSYYVQFYMYHGSSDTYNRHVAVSVAGAEQQQLDTVFYKAAASGVAKHVLTWTATTSGECSIQFKGNVPAASYGSLYLDDIEIDAVPSCLRPEEIVASGVNSTTVDVTITDFEAAHTAWEIAFGPKGCNPDSVAAIAVSAKNAQITVPAMTAGAQYDVYVRAVCSADDKSQWTLPFTFKFIDWTALSPNFTFVNSVTYPWTLTQVVGDWTATSGNYHVDSSESDLKGVITVEPNTKVIVSFDYFVESESASYDYLCIFIDGATTNLADFGKLGGSATTGTYTLTFNTPGEHSITWRYRKDSSTSTGADVARISNINVRVISCVEPTTFNLTSLTGTSATVSWNATSADQYEVRFYNAPQVTLRSDSTLLSADTISTNSKDFAGLRPNTQYYVYVRSLCGGSPSDWSSVFSFRTECAPYQLPFVENFEAAGSELCWKVIGNAVTMNTVSAAPFEGAKSLSVYNDSVVGMLVSPRLDAASLAAYEVSLAVKLSDVRYHAAALKPLTIGVMTDPSNAGTYVDLGDIVIPSANSWKEYTFSLADLATPDYADWANAQYVVVSMSDSATYQFDAIAVNLPSTCAKPTALDVQPNGEDVIVDWVSEATAHYAEIALGDSVVFAGNVAKPFTPANLEGNTVYTIRVRAICDADSSEWSAALAFKTPCTFTALPYSENFNSYSTTATSYSRPNTVNLPECWYFEADPTDNDHSIFLTSGSDYAVSGNAMVFRTKDSYKPLVAALPTMDAQNKALIMKFTYRNYSTGESYQAPLEVGYLTTYGDTSSFVLLKTLDLTTTKTREEVIIPAAPVAIPAFRQGAIYSYSYYVSSVDNIEVDFAPTCLKPTDLRLAAYDADSATIAWTAAGTETQWELIYKLNNGAADTLLLTAPRFTVTGLQPNISYTINVLSLAAVCSAEDKSEARTATFTFKTPCATEALPFEENFANGINDCWTRYSGPLFADGVSTASATPVTTGWTKSNKVYTNEVKLNIYGTVCKSWLVSPSFKVTDAATTLSFDYALTAYNATTAILDPTSQLDDKFIVAISTDGNTWHRADATIWSNDNQGDSVYNTVPNTGAHFTKSLAQYVGQTLRVAFYGESTASGGDNDFHVANFVVSAPVSCDRPAALSVEEVTAETATIKISDVAAANAWEYALNSQDATPVAISDTIFTIAGLTAQTNYTVYVRRVCGAGNESAWRSVSFRTACGIMPLPFAENFEIPAGSTTPAASIDCWILPAGVTVSSGSYSAGGAGYSLKFATTSSVVTVLPDFGNLNGQRLSFTWRCEGTGSNSTMGYIKAGYITDVTDNNTFVELADYHKHEYEHTPAAVNFTNVPEGARAALMYYGATSSGWYFYVDDVEVDAMPACERPTALTLLGVTPSSATLKVTDAEDANAWEYALDSAAMANPVAFANDTFTISGLQAETAYVVYVRRSCSATDKSAWIKAEFQTACDYAALPFLENFNSLTAGIPSCWDNEEGTTTSAAYKWSYYATGFTGVGLRFNSFSNSTGNTNVLKTPACAIETTGTVDLSFQFKNSTGGAMELLVSHDGGQTFTQLDRFAAMSVRDWTEESYTFPVTAGDHVVVAFKAISNYGSGDAYLYLDDIALEMSASCAKPQGLSVLSVSATQLDLQIADTVSSHNAWQVAVGAEGFNPDQATAYDAIATLTSVNPATPFVSGQKYEAYVRAVCGEGDNSAWRGPVAFKYTDYSTFVPAGTTIVSPTSYTWDAVTEAGVQKLQSTNIAVANAPCDMVMTVTVPEGSEATLSFNYYVSAYNSSYSNYGKLYVYQDVANPTASNATVTLTGTTSTPYSSTGVRSMKIYAGTHTIRWRYFAETTTTSYNAEWLAQVWNIQVAYNSFFAPGDLKVENLTSEAAKLTWAACGDATSNQVNFKTNGLDTLITVTDNFLQMNGLETNTSYQFRVRSFAANGDSTAWSSYKAFKTPCVAYALPFSEGFEGTTFVPDCWSTERTEGTGTDGWVRNTTASNVNTGAGSAKLSDMTSGTRTILVTPAIENANNAPLRLRFAMYRTTGTSKMDEGVKAWVNSTPDLNGATPIMHVTRCGGVPADAIKVDPITVAGWYSYTKEFAANGTFYVIFEGISEYGLSSYMDDILIEEVPECEAPASLSVVTLADSLVTVHVEDNDTAHTSWQVALCTPSVAVDSSAAQLAVTDSAAIARIVPAPALIADSTYVIYARAICDEGVYSPWISKTIKYVDYSALSTTLSFTSEGDYPWEIITDNGLTKAQNTNDTVSNSYSDLVTTVVVPAGEIGTLSFDFTVNAYSDKNYFVMYVDEANPDETNYDAEFGQQKSTYESDYYYDDVTWDDFYTYTCTPVDSSWTIDLGEGTHTIRWRYYNVFAQDSRTYGAYDSYFGYYNVTENYVYGEMGRHARIYNVQYTSTSSWAPKNLDAHAIGADSAIVSWTQCKDVVLNEVKVGENVYTATADSIILRNLESNTEYKLVVRSITATDTTAWSDTLAFRTECSIVSLPYATGFEAADGGLACWTIRQSHAPTSGTTQYGDEGWRLTTRTDATSTSSTVHSGLAAVQLRDASDGTRTLLISPEFEADSVSLVKVGFWMYRTISSSFQKPDEGVKVWANTADNLTDATALIHVTSWGGAAGSGIKVDPVTVSGWYYYEAVLPAGATYAIFEGISEYGRSSYLDDVRISRVALGDTIHDAICEGYPYTQNGFNIPASELTPGYHEYSVIVEATDPSQADSIRPLVLFVSQATTIEVTDTVCYGGSYTKYGFNRSNITASRDLRYDGVNMYGCDSTFIAHIFVPEHEYASNVSICEGESYVFGDTTIYTAGRYVKTFKKTDCDCDSTVTLVLNVLAASSEYSYTICQGETYAFGTKVLDVAGDYTETFKNILGCDSVVTLHLTVQAPEVTTFNETFCEGTVFTADNVSPKFVALTQAGEYRDTIKTVSGCDSILVLNLTETKTVKVTLNEEVCKNDIYVFAGNTFNVLNDTTITLNTVSEVTGCDSIVTLNIKVKDCDNALENVNAYALEINPNPVNVGEEAIIRTDIVFTAGYVLRVYDPAGRLVCESTDPNGRVPGLPVAGAYTVRISTADQNYQAKLIVR